jgi:hypothetical protein
MESRSTYATEPLTVSENTAARWAANLPLNSPAQAPAADGAAGQDVLRNAVVASDSARDSRR